MSCIMPFGCEEFQVFHFRVIFFLSCSNFFFLFSLHFFIKIIKHIKVIWCQGKYMNNMRRQAYGVWRLPPHMLFTIASV
jgi:hypothetical protein